MIKQLLSFAGGKERRREAVSLVEVIREVQDILKHTLPKSIELHLDVMIKLWPVVGDSTELCQLLLNLWINARDAMPDGGHLTIAAENCASTSGGRARIPTWPSGPHVMLSISDTGTGIPRKSSTRFSIRSLRPRNMARDGPGVGDVPGDRAQSRRRDQRLQRAGQRYGVHDVLAGGAGSGRRA